LDVNTKVEITYEESASGCKKMVEYEAVVVCDQCAGDAEQSNTEGSSVCTKCNGMVRKTKKKIELEIPQNAKNGFKKTYKGLGNQGDGETCGDLIVEFIVADHPFFRRTNDDDTICDVHISVYQAVLGTKIQIPKLYSKDGEKTEVTIEAGIQPNTLIRLPNQGFTKSNCKKKRGDLFINIVIDIPTHVTKQQKELFERLAAIDSMLDLHLSNSPPPSPTIAKSSLSTLSAVADASTAPHALVSLKQEKNS